MSDSNQKGEILLESGTNELEVMEFTVDGKHFGINVSKVVEIMPYYEITPMPNSNEYVEGIFKPREIIMTVIDLAKYLKLRPEEATERNILIITNFNKAYSAFHVHTVEAIHRISWEAIEKPDSSIYGQEEGMATGIAHFDDRLITILDFEKILTDINPLIGIQASEIAMLGKRATTDKPILIAEDSPFLEKMIVEALHQSGFTNVTVCNNGKEAWDKMLSYKKTELTLETQVTCVITDIEMPQMDGHRLCKLIKEDEFLKAVPIIIFSSLINSEMRLKGEAVGATAQLSKPEIGKLVQLIDKHML